MASEFSLITARHVKNLTITGGGVINGNGPTWWPHTTAPLRAFSVHGLC